MDNLTIIGTSHIAKQSVKKIKKEFLEIDPDIVAIELDKQRLYSLMHKKQKMRIKDVFRVGIKGYLFVLIGAWAEKKMGDMVGMKPGADMLAGVRLAKKNNKKIAFIDQNIEITLKKLSKGISWKEKRNFVVDIFKGVVLRKKEIEFDLSSVPDQKTIDLMIKKVKGRYPNIYRILVAERNEFMARRLKDITSSYPEKKVLAIVGAGHKEDMEKILDNTGITYSFSFNASS